MPKHKYSLKKSLNAFYYIDALYWYRPSEFLNKIVDIVYIFSAVIVTFGNVNYLSLLYQNGTRFEEVAFNVSWLISTLFAFFAINKMKQVSRIGHYLAELVDRNIILRNNALNVHQIVAYTNLLQNNIIGYIAIFLAAGYFVIEFKVCDDFEKPYSCGFIFPSYLFINMHKRPYRDLYNLICAFLLGYLFITLALGLVILFFAILYIELLSKDVQRSLKVSRFIQLRAMRLQKLKEIHQQQLISTELWNNLMDLYKWPLLVEYVAAVVNIPLILISSLIEFNLLSLVHVSLYIIGTLACGYFAEKMKNINEQYRHDFFYACPWDGDLTNTKYLLLMNLNSNSGFKVLLGHFGTYSNEAVLKVLRWAYSIVMVYIQYDYKRKIRAAKMAPII